MFITIRKYFETSEVNEQRSRFERLLITSNDWFDFISLISINIKILGWNKLIIRIIIRIKLRSINLNLKLL